MSRMPETPTATLNNGTAVYAKPDGYPWCGMHQTMAATKAAKLAEDGIAVEPYRVSADSRVTYLRIIPPTKPTVPADCILRGTGILGDGTPTEEEFTCSKAEFAAEQGFEDGDPVVLAVLELEPGESTVFDMGAGGAWKIRCLTMDEAAAELDREATAEAETTAARETLALGETLFGREASSFREAVRLAAEKVAAETGHPAPRLAHLAMQALLGGLAAVALGEVGS